MPKKKQVTFQNNKPGKFIPRDDTPPPSVFRSGTNANRFNSKMAELLASSSSSSSTTTPIAPITPINNENEPIINEKRSIQDEIVVSNTPEMTTIDSSRVHSKLLHRRIVTMLETLRRRNGNGGTTSPTSSGLKASHINSKSQPITFGQLRQATTTSSVPTSASSSTVVEDITPPKIISARSYTDLRTMNIPDRPSYHRNIPSSTTDIRSDLISTPATPINRSSSKHKTNQERQFYSSSVEQLLEQHHIASRKNEQDENKQEEQQQQQQQPKPSLTVDEILATYYSKIKVSTMNDTQSPPPPPPPLLPLSSTSSLSSSISSFPTGNAGFYARPPSTGWNSSPTNPYHIPTPKLLLNEQNRNRPPPPSYSFSVANGHRPPPTTTNNLAQHLIRPPVPSSIREHAYSGPQVTQHLLPGNSPVTQSASPPIQLPLPNYEIPTSNIERSHSALSSVNRPNYSAVNPPQAGFDPEFSRLLYGKDGGKSRHQRQKRKAFSDPVKKSVEEAGRSIEKTHRRLTTHLNKTDTVKEEEENTSDSTEIDKQEKTLPPQRHSQKKTELNRETAKKAIVPANPLLKRRIPSFLRVYSQVSSSNDILLQWHLFSLSDLESYDAMMKKLYKDENLARVQMYENYRALISSTLISKRSMKIEDDNDEITTTAL